MKPRHLVAAFLAILVLYLLSIGPVIALAERSAKVISDPVAGVPFSWIRVVVVYQPVIWLAEQSEVCSAILLSYVDLWRRLIGRMLSPGTLQT